MKGKEKNTYSKKFKFCKHDYNLAGNTEILTRSNFNSFANFDPLAINDGALESSHKEKFVLGLLSGGRDNYKHTLLVQGKRTIWLSLDNLIILYFRQTAVMYINISHVLKA